jgi:diguanylate cyclase (GGDEF)-like protein
MEEERGVHIARNILFVLGVIIIILFAALSYVNIRQNSYLINSLLEQIGSIGNGAVNTLVQNAINTNLGILVLVAIETLILTIALVITIFIVMYLTNKYIDVKNKMLIDPLTGLYNRRMFMKNLDREIERAKRFKHPLSLIMMDVDHFKVYNDTHGHVAGDKLLKKFAKILARKIRDIDTLARYGGEEFVILLPEANSKEAEKAAERLRKDVESTAFQGGERQPGGKVTLSLGVVTYHGDLKKGEDVIHNADEMLYEAKRNGRNQVKKIIVGA